MLLESVRSALERRGYDVTSAEPTDDIATGRHRWRPPDVVADGDDALACWIVDQVQPSTVLRAQAAARRLEARPLLVGEAVDDGAQPWARRYDVEVLAPDAVDGSSAPEASSNGSNGAHGRNGSRETGSRPAATADGEGSREPAPSEATPSRPALGGAPPVGDGPAPQEEPGPPPADVEPRDPPEATDEGGSDVFSLLDLPADPRDAAPGHRPPAWLAPRPLPGDAPIAEPDEDSGSPGTTRTGDPPAGSPVPTLAGIPPDPGSRKGSPGARERSARSNGNGREPGTGGDLPWDPADADPPAPSTNGEHGAVDPPGTPRDQAADDTPEAQPGQRVDGAPPAHEDPEPPEEPPGHEDGDPREGPPDGPGRTSLDALVEATAQSPQPAAGAPTPTAGDGAPDAAGAPDDAPSLQPETLGDEAQPPSTSTDPRKIAEDVMREQEEASDDPPRSEPDHTSPNPTKTGSELLGVDRSGTDDAPAGDPPGEPEEAPWQAEDEDVGGPAPAGSITDARDGGPGAAAIEAPPDPDPSDAPESLAPDETPEPVGTDDAAMRRHEPDLWGTTGRLDDVRTSLRDAGDSFHARARANGPTPGPGSEPDPDPRERDPAASGPGPAAGTGSSTWLDDLGGAAT